MKLVEHLLAKSLFVLMIFERVYLVEIQSNLTLVAVKIRDNLTLRDKMKMTVFLCSKSPSK